MLHTKCSNFSYRKSDTSGDLPRDRNAWKSLRCDFSSFKGPGFLPHLTKAPVELHPVNACVAGRALQISGPSSPATLFMSIRPLDVFKSDPCGGFHFMSFDIILMMDCFIAFIIMYMYCIIIFDVFVRDMIL